MGVFNPSVDSNKLGSMGRSGSLSSKNDDDTKTESAASEGGRSPGAGNRPPTPTVHNKDSKIKINLNMESGIFGGDTTVRKFIGPQLPVNGHLGGHKPTLSSSAADDDSENSVVAGVVTECKDNSASGNRTLSANSNGNGKEYGPFIQSEHSKILVQQQNRNDMAKVEDVKPDNSSSHTLSSKNGVVNRNDERNTNGSSWFQTSPRSNGVGGTYVQLPKPKVVLYDRKKIIQGWRMKLNVGVGFINLGNTCYMNAALQVLLHTPAFLNWLLEELRDTEHKSKCENSVNHDQCTICPMINIALSLYHSQAPVRPMPIHNKLRVIGKNFNYGRQEDSHEFLRLLLESMERSYLTARPDCRRLDSRSKETSPLGQIFGGYTRSEVRCLTCRQISTTFHPHAELQLDIREVNNVEDALEFYFQEERLDNDDYKCEWCKCVRPATKKQFMEIAPIVLCIQLKRFRACGSKIKKPIFVNETLDLTRFMFHRGTNEKQTPCAYRLIGLVTHIGPSPNFGHYTAIAQAHNGNYYHFDDSCVRITSLNQAQNADAYIIMYESIPAKLLSSITKSSPIASSASTVAPKTSTDTVASPVSSSANGDGASKLNSTPQSNASPNSEAVRKPSPPASSTAVGNTNSVQPSKPHIEFRFSNLINPPPSRPAILTEAMKSNIGLLSASQGHAGGASAATHTASSSEGRSFAVSTTPKPGVTKADESNHKKPLVPYSSDDEDDDDNSKSMKLQPSDHSMEAPPEANEAPVVAGARGEDLSSSSTIDVTASSIGISNDKKRPLEASNSNEDDQETVTPSPVKKAKEEHEVTAEASEPLSLPRSSSPQS